MLDIDMPHRADGLPEMDLSRCGNGILHGLIQGQRHSDRRTEATGLSDRRPVVRFDLQSGLLSRRRDRMMEAAGGVQGALPRRRERRPGWERGRRRSLSLSWKMYDDGCEDDCETDGRAREGLRSA